jgi:hypothetical protein
MDGFGGFIGFVVSGIFAVANFAVADAIYRVPTVAIIKWMWLGIIT